MYMSHICQCIHIINREEILFIGIQMEDRVWSPAQLSLLKDNLRECLFSWYAFLCWNGLENFDIFYICHNNVHGNDLLFSSVGNLHLACYTESLVVVLFLLPNKCRQDLNLVARIFVWYNTYSIWINASHITVTTSVCVYINILLWTYDR